MANSIALLDLGEKPVVSKSMQANLVSSKRI